jgi:hypothetical protein
LLAASEAGVPIKIVPATPCRGCEGRMENDYAQ